MPKCIVDYCRNYAGMRKNYANVILHGFPTTLERIKLWLRAIEQSGQVFENLDQMAEKIREGKKYDSYRVCSEHFTIQCYFVNGDKKILKKESIPTVFANRHAVVPCVQKHVSKRKRQEQLHSLAKRHLKKKATESLKENKETPKPKKHRKKKTKNWKNGQELAQKILNLTLEIIDLLTGEDYIVVKKSCPQVKLDRRTQCSKMVPQSRMLDWVNEHRILELTNKMVELLSGEEQNYRTHKEAFTGVRMENPPSLPSPGASQETDTAHAWLSSPSSMDVETVIIQDVQESKCFKISTWTAISEANGTNKLVLHEDSVVPDAAPCDLQILSVQVVEEPLLSEDENPKVYTQQMATEEEPLPHRHDQPSTDLYTHFDAQSSSVVYHECSPCEGIILPPNYVQHNADYVDTEPITSKGQNVPETDTTEQSGPKQDSSACIKEETQSLRPLGRKHFQYRSEIKEEDLSPSAGHVQNPDTHPQCIIIKEEPSYCEEVHFPQTDRARRRTRVTAAVCIKEEAASCVEDVTPSTIHTTTSNIHCISYTTS